MRYSVRARLAPALALAASGASLNSFYRTDFKPALVRARLPKAVRFHDLRHTCASLLIANGAHPKAVSEVLGHSTIAITMNRYAHLYDDDMAGLADKLDAVYRSTSLP
jgi:integrase